MAGIYLHIPFCRSRCAYCDFFSSTSLDEKESYVDALCRELHARKNYLQGQIIETIYFGGGTPSQLSAGDFEKIFQTIDNTLGEQCLPKPAMEITLEANPDDLTPEYVSALRHLPFNRISLGIQSLNDTELRSLNRRHNAVSAIQAVKRLQENGFSNISMDLIYGLPGQTQTIWQNTLKKAIALNVPHISAYHLTYEEGTPLFQKWQQGEIQPATEDLSIQLFEILIDRLEQAGYEHYEISNFARPGFRSRHNSAYWNGAHYLGIGAAAHSYNGCSRQWNPSLPGARYLDQAAEIEEIDAKTAYNDFVITRLRTHEGIDLEELNRLFGENQKDYCLKQAQKFLQNKTLEINSSQLYLTRKGLFISDGIMSDLML
ncbi:MAG: radical SAM family heme chaperone HemW [Dysgonamonadaceae bacterium]|jgi:oxygen-independent coproporphyrinogen-3 oxidase|nr:radical SAM family heme chaperone HemW [Dysgonamonadaceae bacterium]